MKTKARKRKAKPDALTRQLMWQRLSRLEATVHSIDANLSVGLTYQQERELTGLQLRVGFLETALRRALGDEQALNALRRYLTAQQRAQGK